MIPIAQLRDKYAGRVGVILGGGPSLEGDFAAMGGRRPPLQETPIWIAVNHHAETRLPELQADYMVFLDEPERFPRLRAAVEEIKGKCLRVTWREGWSDVDLTPGPSPDHRSGEGGKTEEPWIGCYASHLATWLGCYIGCEPVILCGMDCYQGERSRDADPRDRAYQIPLEVHLEGWRQAFEKCPHPERIKAASGPLVEVFGRWP